MPTNLAMGVKITAGGAPGIQSLRVVSTDAAKIDLAWTDTSNPDVIDYDLQRSPTGAETWTVVATPTIGVEQQADTPPDDAVYDYRLVSNPDSAVSNTVTARMRTVPNAPVLTATGDIGNVDLAWDSQANIDAYKVYRSQVSGGPYTEIADLAGNIELYEDIPPAGTNYYVVDAEKTYTYPTPVVRSNEDSAAPLPPSTPQNLVGVGSTDTSITLDWDASTGADSYAIERSTAGAGGPFSQIATVTAPTVTYEDTGLETGTEYWYRVRAFNYVGPSAYSNVSSAVPGVSGVPATGLQLYLPQGRWWTNAAAMFNSANEEYLDIPSNADVQSGNADFFISGWMMRTGINFVTSKWSATEKEYYISLQGGSVQAFYSGNGTSQPALAQAGVADNVWLYCLFWHDSAGDQVGFITDDATAVTASISTGLFAGNAPFRVSSDNLVTFYDGQCNNLVIGKTPTPIAGLIDDIHAQLWNNGNPF
ncbi:MAG: fibronectin type III domain-containing protein, partial [Candidatus Thorarchaeota archaeon]